MIFLQNYNFMAKASFFKLLLFLTIFGNEAYRPPTGQSWSEQDILEVEKRIASHSSCLEGECF